MLIRIEDIKENGLSREYEEPLEEFPGLSEAGEDSEWRIEGPVRVRLRAVRTRDLVEVDGAAEATARLSCSRCLKDYASPLAADFALTFSREVAPSGEEGGDDEVELRAEELGLIPFQGEEIDLRGPVEEQLLMALPLQPLCNLACKGLCPHCGADLNAGPCGCAPPAFDSRFGALKDFRVDKKK